MQELGRNLLEKNLGDLPANWRKKVLTPFEQVNISNGHGFSKGHHGFQIGSLLQENMACAGRANC